MSFSAKPLLLVSLLAAIGVSSAFAQTAAPAAPAAPAAAAAPENTLSFNVGVVTDYRYRGISQSRLKPAAQGGIDFSHASGAYIGTWASTIQWVKDSGGKSDLELDIYGGYKGNAGPVAYDVGVLTYVYPSNGLPVSANTTEIYGAGTIGPATLKYSHALTNTFGFAGSKNSGYLDLTANFDMGSGFTLAPHVGHQRIAGTGNGIYSYTDYSLTLTKDFGNGVALSAAVVGSDAKDGLYVTPAGKNTGKNGVVVGLKYSF
jgi:uncharacterized protein (TIGR02001 family)